MYNISVEKECGCFIKSDLQNNLEIENKEDALLKAIDMKREMDITFCGKHDYEVREESNNFVISFGQPTQKASGGCCGGGCGTH